MDVDFDDFDEPPDGPCGCGYRKGEKVSYQGEEYVVKYVGKSNHRYDPHERLGLGTDGARDVGGLTFVSCYDVRPVQRKRGG